MRRFTITAASVLTLAAAAAPAALAANPPGTGEPGVAFNVESCPTDITTPQGFTSPGFANTATGVYANPAPAMSGTASGNPHAVSEYDIACFQTSQH